MPGKIISWKLNRLIMQKIPHFCRYHNLSTNFMTNLKNLIPSNKNLVKLNYLIT